MIIWRAKVLIFPKLPKLFPSSCVFCLCLWYMHLDGTGLFGDKCHIHLKGLGYGLSISQSISRFFFFFNLLFTPVSNTAETEANCLSPLAARDFPWNHHFRHTMPSWPNKSVQSALRCPSASPARLKACEQNGKNTPGLDCMSFPPKLLASRCLPVGFTGGRRWTARKRRGWILEMLLQSQSGDEPVAWWPEKALGSGGLVQIATCCLLWSQTQQLIAVQWGTWDWTSSQRA